MIYIERTINIEDNSAYIDEPVILYKGDGNIEVQFTINNNPFKYKSGIDQIKGQLIIKRPTADPIFSDAAKLSSKLSSDKETIISIVNLVITGEMIDELVELGSYDFQIRLLHTEISSRATLPSVTAGILIKEPICEESVNTAPVNYSRAAINREILDTFDEEGNYNKTNWSNGDIITDNKLNKVEDAIYQINDNSAAKEDIPVAVSQLENDADYATKDDIPTDVSAFTNDAGYLTEHQSLEDYALKTDIPSTDGLATEQYVNEFIDSLDVSYFPNSIGYVTEAYVDDAVNNIEIPEVDLSDYATKDYVDEAITNIEVSVGDVDLSNYYTKDEVTTRLAVKSDTTHNHDGVYAEYNHSHNMFSITGLTTNYYTKSSVDNKLADKANKADVYTKTEVDSAIANAQLGGGDGTVDLSGYVTKEYVDSIITVIDKIDIGFDDLPDGNYTCYLKGNLEIRDLNGNKLTFIGDCGYEIVQISKYNTDTTKKVYVYTMENKYLEIDIIKGTVKKSTYNVSKDYVNQQVNSAVSTVNQQIDSALGDIERLLGGI